MNDRNWQLDLTIDCQRLQLKLFDDTVLAELYDLIRKNRNTLIGKITWVDSLRNIEDFQLFLKYCLQQAKNKEAFYFAIYLEESIVGCIDFHHFNYINHSCEIGYWLDQEKRGQGIITRSLIGLMSLFIEQFSMQCFYIIVHVTNTNSRRIPEILGFTNEGLVSEQDFTEQYTEDKILYSLSKQMFKQKLPIWEQRFRLIEKEDT